MPTAANDYLLAHQGFSPRISLQGIAPYVRTVSRSVRSRGADAAGSCASALLAGLGLGRRRRAGAIAEALGWLRKMQDATQKLSYTGTFFYQNGTRSETSRITRYADPAGDIEKVEVLDGVPREIVRTRGHRALLPARPAGREGRPAHRGARLPGHAAGENHRAGPPLRHQPRRDPGRIADYDCQEVVLTPREQPALRATGCTPTCRAACCCAPWAVDGRRRGRSSKSCSLSSSIGKVTREMVRPRHASGSWRVEDAGGRPGAAGRLGGLSERELPGFQKVFGAGAGAWAIRARRRSSCTPTAWRRLSVFIESLEGDAATRCAPGSASMGAIHIYTREVANHVVTVVGEAPAASVQRIGNAVEYRRPQ